MDIKLEEFGHTKHECPKCGTKGMFDTPRWYEELNALRVPCRACGWAYFTKTKDSE